jgi:hypothetical protein
MESVWTMSESKAFLSPGEILEDTVTVVVDGGRDTQQLPGEFTLRVKPDRRCVQLPIPAELDRRRKL